MNELKIPTLNGVGYLQIGRESLDLVNKIRNSPIWCTVDESKPSMFWANILTDATMIMSDTLRNIIRSALAIPAGSAAAERSFGILNYVKDPHRATLSQDNTNHIVRIRHNGPRTGAIKMEWYAEKYLQSHERCDPLHDTTGMKKKAKNEKLDRKNVYSNIFAFPDNPGI